MLVLSRKVGETIQIDKDVAVTVLKVKGNRVRIGIEAPGHVSIQRRELVLDVSGDDDDEPGQLEAKPAA